MLVGLILFLKKVDNLIHSVAITRDFKVKEDMVLEELFTKDILWFWVDFDIPTEEESKLLDTHFQFHHLAIEDCLHFLQRPKLDYYEDYSFFVLHALNEATLRPEEVDLFVAKNFVVSFHLVPLREIEEAREKLLSSQKNFHEGSVYAAYTIFDKLVDNYFPAIYQLEDYINDLDENEENNSIKYLMDELFEVRGKLLKLRRIVNQMKDLLYRLLNSDRLDDFKKKHIYFTDVYDHLLRLSEMIESSQAMTAEMRENYISINSNRMNAIMMILTVVTSIFIPLTFIAGIYGMNFEYMPELHWKYGYFIVLFLMALIGIVMYWWFRKKGWFNFYK
jgi:magnesium transporter